jgi:hypothetical protein
MTRLLTIFLLSCGLACLLASPTLAAELAQQPQVDVYKSPG